ncbi:MAG: hypothetical protein DPW09_19270 [Anaerolineae bacterium]|nr:hypothetical protein [Anaerolineae bacterium]MCQ3975583.1 hypothetical protein [Anaerolineae bacterium]
MSENKATTKAKRRRGFLELIVILATVIPCCLGIFAFFGVVGGATTCPTFPRGSAGDIKTFTLAYNTTAGIPTLKGAWLKVYSNSGDAPGEITFYRQ